MFSGQRLKDLADARRSLVLQGDLHRSLLRLETAALRERFAGLVAPRDSLLSRRPLWVAGAVLAGVLAVRRWRALLRWAPTAVAAYRWFRRLTAR